ncbi:MAG: hypothetical protein Q7W02_20415 [Candidatus Rokubacteria bacterium]|nr:hypothetical protein [Candidatus Rokubacteria bacterium]
MVAVGEKKPVEQRMNLAVAEADPGGRDAAGLQHRFVVSASENNLAVDSRPICDTLLRIIDIDLAPC